MHKDVHTVRSETVPKDPSIRSMVLEAMQAGPADGMSVTRIRNAILDRRDRRIALTNLHVIVRQLEKEGVIVRIGHVRVLADGLRITGT